MMLEPNYHGIYQILLNSDSTRLVVLGHDTCQVWSLGMERIEVIIRSRMAKLLNASIIRNGEPL